MKSWKIQKVLNGKFIDDGTYENNNFHEVMAHVKSLFEGDMITRRAFFKNEEIKVCATSSYYLCQTSSVDN